MNINKTKNYVLLHFILFLYSIGALYSKLASNKTFLSSRFILFYVITIVILIIYAIAWQQILKKMPLTTAFANKSVVILWGMLWGKLIFGEAITIFMILGAAIIFTGITLVVNSDG